jgi:hypothetical protein
MEGSALGDRRQALEALDLAMKQLHSAVEGCVTRCTPPPLFIVPPLMSLVAFFSSFCPPLSNVFLQSNRSARHDNAGAAPHLPHNISLLFIRFDAQQSAVVLSNCSTNSSVQQNMAFVMASDA